LVLPDIGRVFQGWRGTAIFLCGGGRQLAAEQPHAPTARGLAGHPISSILDAHRHPGYSSAAH